MSVYGKTKIGNIAVDSGQIMIIDPCYIEDGFNNEFDPDTKGQKRSAYEMNYDGCCNASLNAEGYGQLGNKYSDTLGFVSRTLYGDGVYPVYAEVDGDGRVKSITIDFDDEPEDDSCGYCGEHIDDCRCDDEGDEG